MLAVYGIYIFPTMKRLLEYVVRRDTDSETQNIGAESPVVKERQKHLALTIGAIVGVVVLAFFLVFVVTYYRRRRSTGFSFGFRSNFAPLDDEATIYPQSDRRNNRTPNVSVKRHGCLFSRDASLNIWAKISSNNNQFSQGPGSPQFITRDPIPASECASQSSRSPVPEQLWPGTIHENRPYQSRRHTAPVLNSHRSNFNNINNANPISNSSDSFVKVGAVNPLRVHPKSPVEIQPPTPPSKSPSYTARFNKRLPSIASVATETSDSDLKLDLDPPNQTLNLNHRIENPIPSPSLDFPSQFGFESLLFPPNPHFPHRMSSMKSCQAHSITKSSSVITLPGRSTSNSTLSGAPPLHISASVLSRWRRTREAADIPPLPVEVLRPESCTLGNSVGCGCDCDCDAESMSIRDAERVDLTGSIYLCRGSSIY